MVIKSLEDQNIKKTYQKPELEITIFETEKICLESGVLGDIMGMSGVETY